MAKPPTQPTQPTQPEPAPLPTQPDPAPPPATPNGSELLPQPVPQPVEEVDIVQVDAGLRCPACGRDMVPRVRTTRPEKRQRYADCTLCGAKLVISYRPDGSPLTVRRT